MNIYGVDSRQGWGSHVLGGAPNVKRPELADVPSINNLTRLIGEEHLHVADIAVPY